MPVEMLAIRVFFTVLFFINVVLQAVAVFSFIGLLPLFCFVITGGVFSIIDTGIDIRADAVERLIIGAVFVMICDTVVEIVRISGIIRRGIIVFGFKTKDKSEAFEAPLCFLFFDLCRDGPDHVSRLMYCLKNTSAFSKLSTGMRSSVWWNSMKMGTGMLKGECR